MSSYVLGDSNSVFIKLNGFKNLAEPGSRVRDVFTKLKSLDSGEVLILGVGVNDSATIVDLESGNKLELDLIKFEKDYLDLLSLAKSKFERIVALGLISSIENKVRLGDAEIQYSNKTIVKFNEKIQELCEKLEVEFVDFLPYFLGKEKELLMDHIHPNEKGREIILSELRSLI